MSERCVYCGKYVACHVDRTVGARFTPDTHFTSEKTEWFHWRCENAALDRTPSLAELFWVKFARLIRATPAEAGDA